MECRINGVVVHCVEHGTGMPLVALHGAGVDHREIEAAVEAIVPATGYRRIYPDLPGMGHSATNGLTCNDDVVKLLGDLIDHLAGGPVLLLGHSYGAYLARGVAAQRPDVVRGLALLCPLGEQSRNVPDHDVVRQDAHTYDELEPAQRAGFDEYFVVRTPATARRYRDHVVPGTELVDEAALGRIFSAWPIDVGAQIFRSPTLIAAGRRDSVVGYTDATDLLERYPRGHRRRRPRAHARAPRCARRVRRRLARSGWRGSSASVAARDRSRRCSTARATRAMTTSCVEPRWSTGRRNGPLPDIAVVFGVRRSRGGHDDALTTVEADISHEGLGLTAADRGRPGAARVAAQASIALRPTGNNGDGPKALFCGAVAWLASQVSSDTACRSVLTPQKT